MRYSLENPYAYVNSNVMGQVVMLEAARRLEQLRCFVYASSSSVYGANEKQPFSVDDPVELPISLYAATKRSCELSARTYSHLFKVTACGLRFFTVYGPWGEARTWRLIFSRILILGGQTEQIFSTRGKMERDFTTLSRTRVASTPSLLWIGLSDRGRAAQGIQSRQS